MTAMLMADASSDVEPDTISVVTNMMGGTVGVHLRATADDQPFTSQAGETARSTLRRLQRWADRLSRFVGSSDIVRLNDSPDERVPIGATLAAVLDWARQAESLSDGVVDVTLLDARLRAEGAADPCSGNPSGPGDRSWSMDRTSRATFVRRTPGLRLDIDGVAKGWLADRALARLGAYPAAVVDADGDVAIRLDPGQRWRFGVADPRTMGTDLAELDLTGRDEGGRRTGFGLATSGTTVHRWAHDGRTDHHLIDPRTGRPAHTDVVQATVLARTAREAEALAKTALILGSVAGLERLAQHDVDGAILLTETGRVLLTPATARWLA